MGRHRRRMKREEIRELKAFPVGFGPTSTVDDAWFRLDRRPASDDRRDDDEAEADDARQPVEDEDMADRLALGDSSPVSDEGTHLGEGQAPVAL